MDWEVDEHLPIDGDEKEKDQNQWEVDYHFSGEAKPVDQPWYEQAGDALQAGYQRGKKFISQNIGEFVDETEDDRMERSVRLAELERRAQVHDPDLDMQQKIADIDQSQTWGEFVQRVWENPEAVGIVTLQSIGMFAPVLATTAGVGAATGGVGTTIALAGTAGLGSFSTEYAATMNQAIQEAGYDPADPLSWFKAYQDKDLMDQARESGKKRGIAIGIFDALSAGVAGKLLAGAKPTATSILGRGAAETGVQAVSGAAGEASAQLYDKGHIESVGSIGLEGIAEVPMSIPEVAVGYKAEKAAAEQRQRENAIREAFNIDPQVKSLSDNQNIVRETLQNLDPMNAQMQMTDPDIVNFEPTELNPMPISPADIEQIDQEIQQGPQPEGGWNAIEEQFQEQETKRAEQQVPRETTDIVDTESEQGPDTDRILNGKGQHWKSEKNAELYRKNKKLGDDWAPVQEEGGWALHKVSQDVTQEIEKPVENQQVTKDTSIQDASQTPPFQPTHETSDGTPVIAGEEENVWLDAEGNEIEDDYTTELKINEKIPTADEIHAKAHEAATSPENTKSLPSEAQIEADNYEKGHIKYDGLKISVENPAGSKRKPEWPPLVHHYGDVKLTEGADGDAIDVFINKDNTKEDTPVFIINQTNKDGSFDEHKVMLGFRTEEEAKQGYLDNYDKGWKAPDVIPRAEMSEFKDWLKNGDTTQPYQGTTEAEYEATENQKAAAKMKQSEKATKRTRANLQPDQDNDDLITFIRKFGGIDVDTESDLKGRLSHLDQNNKTLGLPKIEQTGGKGLTLDLLGEKLVEAGFLPPDPNIGNGVDKDAVIELLSKAEDGTPIRNLVGQEQQAKEKYEQEQQDAYESWLNNQVEEEVNELREELKNVQMGPNIDKDQMAMWMDRAMDIDEQAAEDIISKDIPDAEVIKQLQELVKNDEQTAKQPPKADQPAQEDAAVSEELPSKAESKQAESEGVVNDDYEARYPARVERAKAATTETELNDILAEEYADKDRHFEGTNRIEKIVKDVRGKIIDKQKYQKAIDDGEWVTDHDGPYSEDRNEIQDYIDSKNDDFERQISGVPSGFPRSAPLYMAQKRKISSTVDEEGQTDFVGKTESQQKEQAVKDLEAEKDAKRSGENKPEPAQAQTGNDLFANDGQLEPDLFAQPAETAEAIEAEEEPVNTEPDTEKDWDYQVANFPEPETTTRPATKNPKPEGDPSYITEKEAKQRQSDWKKLAKTIGEKEDHSNEVVISLFDATGEMSKPWREAGYTVYQYDLKLGDDLMEYFPTADLEEIKENGMNVVGVIAQPPCTCFSGSGSRWWKERHDKHDRDMVNKMFGEKASRYFSKPVEYTRALVAMVDIMVEFADPEFTVLENPVGRIAEKTGLPAPTLYAHPHVYGDPYTKYTSYWGDFNAEDMPTANVFPHKGSLMHKMWSTAEKSKGSRSKTPPGVPYAIFVANNTSDITLENMDSQPEQETGPAPAGTVEKNLEQSMIFTEGEYTPLDQLELKADTADETVSDSAANWLQAIDDRIIKANKLRDCM